MLLFLAFQRSDNSAIYRIHSAIAHAYALVNVKPLGRGARFSYHSVLNSNFPQCNTPSQRRGKGDRMMSYV